MPTLEDKTLARVERVSNYRPVTEKEYLAAIKLALRNVQNKLRAIDEDTYTRRRAEEIYRALKEELEKPTTSFLTNFFNSMFSVIMGDTKRMERDTSGYIDGMYTLNESMVKDIIGFKEVFFNTELADGTFKHSMISVDNLLKSVHNDTLKKVKTSIVSGAIQGVNPNKIVRDIGKIPGIEARNLRTVVRTMFADAQARVNMESLKLNQEFYDGYEYSAKLDSRTTLVCRNNDGKKWKTYADIPRDMQPPLHPNCRSVIIGIINT